MLILHSPNDRESRAFVEKYAEGNEVLEWGDVSTPLYLASGKPSPSSFPCVVELVPAAGEQPAGYEIVNSPNSLEEAQAVFDEILKKKEVGEWQVSYPIPPDVEGFFNALKADANFPLPCWPYLPVFAEGLKDPVTTKLMWFRIKSNPEYFMTDKVLALIEETATAFGIHLS